MDFLIHLVIIIGAIGALIWLITSPKSAVFWTATFGCGYFFSSEGFLGTLLGLAVGAVGGGIVAAIIAGIQSLFTPDPPEASREDKAP